jgi:hypothetical protein
VFQNSKWLVKCSGRVQLALGLQPRAATMSRQGFPFPQSILTPNRANGGGQAQVLLDPMGEVRSTRRYCGLPRRPPFHFGSVTLIRRSTCST